MTSSPQLMIAIGVGVVTAFVATVSYRANRGRGLAGPAMGTAALGLRARPFGANQFGLGDGEGRGPGRNGDGFGPTFGASSTTIVPSGTGPSLRLSRQGVRLRSNGPIQQIGGTTSRAFQHPHLLPHLARSVSNISATARNVVILGPGRNVGTQTQVVSVPELHEIAHFFGPDDTVVVVDIQPDIQSVVQASRYSLFDRHVARSIITSNQNYVDRRLNSEEQVEYQSALTGVLDAIPTRPTARIETVVADFADLIPPVGGVDFMFGLQSLVYLMENRTDEELVRHLTRYFAALSERGRLYVDSLIGDRIIALFNGRRNAGNVRVGDRLYKIAQIRPSSDALCESRTPRVIFTLPEDEIERFVSTAAVYMFTPTTGTQASSKTRSHFITPSAALLVGFRCSFSST